LKVTISVGLMKNWNSLNKYQYFSENCKNIFSWVGKNKIFVVGNKYLHLAYPKM